MRNHCKISATVLQWYCIPFAALLQLLCSVTAKGMQQCCKVYAVMLQNVCGKFVAWNQNQKTIWRHLPLYFCLQPRCCFVLPIPLPTVVIISYTIHRPPLSGRRLFLWATDAWAWCPTEAFSVSTLCWMKYHYGAEWRRIIVIRMPRRVCLPSGNCCLRERTAKHRSWCTAVSFRRSRRLTGDMEPIRYWAIWI